MTTHPTNHWDAQLYDQHHGFNTAYGKSLVQELNPVKNEKICDVGCGTGDLTKEIADLGARVLGIDQSDFMIAAAQQKFPELNFQIRDVRELGYQDEFDAIFSNAALHWVKEARAAADSMFRALKPGGRLVIEFGGHRNIGQIVNGINQALEQFGYKENQEKNPWYFPTVADYTSLLEQAHFTVRKVAYFDRPTVLDDGDLGLRHWLNMFASPFFEGIPANIRNEMIRFIETKTRPALYQNGAWYADYKRLRIQAEKPAD
ncbi:MAG: trans-aconitate 2-methyltransferase [Candidatus Margulisiibacteriota bacterium]